jgi:CDP-glucose 4,6-dehydratase
VNHKHWIDRPVLVTGASGLVGSWLVRDLVEAKADVICLIRDFVPESIFFHDGWSQRVTTVQGDIRDISTIERALQEYQINTVFHLAAQTQVGIANRNPLFTFESNIQGTWNILEACRRTSSVKSTVIASSDKAYGPQRNLPYTEETSLEGDHPYDVSKSCTDLLARTYANTYDTPVAITRCGNFYGGGDLNWARIIPGTIRSVVRGEAPVIRSDGKLIRDYLYVEDGASAYMQLAEKLAQNRDLRGMAFNISIERPMNVLDLVKLILASMESNLQPIVENSALNEIPNQYLSAERARSVLGWAPKFTLEGGLEKTIQWYRYFFSSQSA